MYYSILNCTFATYFHLCPDKAHMKNYILRPFLSVTLLMLFSVAYGQTIDIKDFTYSHLSKSDGLHNQRIYSIIQTNDGAIWWSSKHGVERYNGVSIKHYPLGELDIYSDYAGKKVELYSQYDLNMDPPEASGMLAYDNKGRIYSYDIIHDRFNLLADISKMLKTTIDLNNILKVNDGFWLATNKGIYFLQDKTVIPIARGYHANYIIHADKSLLFCTRQGVLEYRQNLTTPPKANCKLHPVVSYDVESGFYDHIYNKVWLGGYSSGVRILSKTNTGYLETNIGITHNPVRAFFPYDIHTMLVGIDGMGVYMVSRRPHENGNYTNSLLFDANDGPHGVLHGNGIYTLIRDIWGSIVIGSYSGGIDIARPVGTMVAVFQHIANDSQSILNDRVNCVMESHSGLLMMGTDNGVSIYNPQTHTMSHTMHGMVILDFCETPRGTILAATYGQGVLEFSESGAFKPLYSTANGILKDDHVFRLFYDRDNNLWIGCLDGDLVHLTSNGTYYHPIHYVKDFLQLPDGNIAVATTYGIHIINPETGKTTELQYAPEQEEDVCRFVHTLYLNNQYELWIGSDGGGIYFYDLKTKKCQHLTVKNGLPSNFVNGIKKDILGRIIIATERGLAFVDPKNKDRIIGVNYCYGVDREYTSRSIANMNNGNIILGSTTGALVVNPKHIQELNYTAKLHILGIKCDDEMDDNSRVDIHKELANAELNLTYKQRTFELLFEAINLRNQPDIVYQYKVGKGEWSTPSDQQFIRFINMEPGCYNLTLRCISRSCGTVIDEVHLTINIGQPWWNSWWMWLVYITTLALAFYGAWRIYQLHTKYMRLVVESLNPTKDQISENPENLDNPEKADIPKDEGKRFISQATQLVIDNITDSDFTIERLCREMAMSRTLFYVKLKSYTGKSPQEFIRIIRLERAVSLLRSGHPVTDAAALSGFDNPKYFSTVFKKYFGVSPSKYQ